MNTLGKPKAEVLARRLSETVPGITVYPLQKHYCAETREEYFVEPYSFAADCIDLVSCKLDLVEDEPPATDIPATGAAEGAAEKPSAPRKRTRLGVPPVKPFPIPYLSTRLPV